MGKTNVWQALESREKNGGDGSADNGGSSAENNHQ